MESKTKTCKFCGKKFKYSQKHRIYCSDRCNQKGQLIIRHNWYLNHKELVLKRQKENPNNARTQRKAVLKKKYNLTPGEYNQMALNQNGRCAICEQPIKLHVDHDHETGKVRGLLCQRCNTGSGLFKHDVKILRNAVKYFKK